MPSSSRLDSLTRGAPLGGPDLEWAKSHIASSSFKKAIDSLKFPKYIVDVEDAASSADIPGESLKHLLQSAMGSDGTSRFQLTALGGAYVNQLLPDEKENIIAIIAERNGSVRELEWAQSSIAPNNFKLAIEALALTEHIANIEDVALYAAIPVESLKHLLQSDNGNDGTSRFQLTALGGAYVNQLLPDEKENIIAIIAERNGSVRELQSHIAMQQTHPPGWLGATQAGSSGHKRPLSQPSAPQATRQRTDTSTSSAGANLGAQTDNEITEMINELLDEPVELAPEAGGRGENAAAGTSRAGTAHGRSVHPLQWNWLAAQQSTVPLSATGGQPPLLDNNDAHAALPKNMLSFAQSSARQPSQTSAKKHFYHLNDAKNHWRYDRASEFKPYMAAWSSAVKRKGKESTKGGAFLVHLSSECDKAEAKGGGKRVEDKNGLRIMEFEVPIEGLPEGQQLRVWRGVNSNGRISLRLAPEGNDKREGLLDGMRNAAHRSIKWKKGMPAGGLPYHNKTAWDHWNSSTRADKLRPYMELWSKATNQKGSDQTRGGAFLVHLSSECDKAEAEGRGKLIETQGGLKIVEFDLPIEGLPEGQQLHVWRGVSSKGSINLYLAPQGNNGREDVLREMRRIAARSINMGSKAQ